MNCSVFTSVTGGLLDTIILWLPLKARTQSFKTKTCDVVQGHAEWLFKWLLFLSPQQHKFVSSDLKSFSDSLISWFHIRVWPQPGSHWCKLLHHTYPNRSQALELLMHTHIHTHSEQLRVTGKKNKSLVWPGSEPKAVFDK